MGRNSVSPKCVKTHGVGKASIQMDLKTKMVMSIIVPCLNEEEVLPLFIRLWKLCFLIWEQKLSMSLSTMDQAMGPFELLKTYREQNPAVHYISSLEILGKKQPSMQAYNMRQEIWWW